MATNVKLPDMGEGIDDVTINRWLVEEGDTIAEGAMLVEVATDKVDTEVPSPAGGTVLKLNFGPGELVGVDAVIAVIGEAGESVDDAGDGGAAEAPVAESTPEPAAPAAEPSAPAAQTDAEDVKATPVARRVAAEEGVDLDAVNGSGPGGQIRKSDVLEYVAQQKGEPSAAPAAAGLPGDYADVPSAGVRRAAADYDVDLRAVAAGRPLSVLTRYDVMAYVAEKQGKDYLPTQPAFPAQAVEAKPAATQAPSAAKPAAEASAPRSAAPAQPKAAAPEAPVGDADEFVPHTRMRTLIARNTAQSAFGAPHVTTMWDVNMSAVLAHRKAVKNDFAKAGVNLTITAYFFQAMIAGIRAVPAANASWREDGLVIHKQIHIGMAVALTPDKYGVGGLIVPVIRNASDLNLMGIARQVNDLAQRARNNQLSADELQGGTITLTNYGTGGSRFQTPIIVQPQVGILGVGAIEKRPIVVSQGHPLEANSGDYLTFAPMTTLGFSYDHRVLDGASADAFCAAVKDALERWA
ncbi:MAG: 2-oxo acid dehydrogenase subunit E2 [Caldilineaceae bacterium]